MLFAVYGVVSAPVGWAVSCVVLVISLATFMLLDVVKCAVYRWWSLESTLWMWPTPGRRARVEERREGRQRKERVRALVRRVRRVMHAVWFIRVVSEMKLQGVTVEGGEHKNEEADCPLCPIVQRPPLKDLDEDLDDCVEMVPVEWDEEWPTA